MGTPTTFATKTFNRVASIAGKYSGIGFAVSFSARASNIGTLTTTAAHGFTAGTIVEIRGVGSTFDGRKTILTAPTSTTFTYTSAGSDVGTTAVDPTGCASKRLDVGHRRYTDSENLEAILAAMTAESQAYFRLSLGNASIATNEALPALIKGGLYIYVGKDTNSDLIDAWDIALSLAAALALDTNYSLTTGDETFPTVVDVRFHELQVLEKKGIAVFDFGEYGGGGIRFLDP